MQVTIDDIIKAAEKNGFEWSQGEFYNKTGDITKACILGQVALNLDISPNALLQELNNIWIEANHIRGYAGIAIWVYNDDKATSYKDAVKHLKQVLSHVPSDTVFNFRKAGRKRRLVRKAGL